MVIDTHIGVASVSRGTNIGAEGWAYDGIVRVVLAVYMERHCLADTISGRTTKAILGVEGALHRHPVFVDSSRG